MDGVIEWLASGLGNGVAWLAEHGVLLAIFALLWVAFGAALVWSQGRENTAPVEGSGSFRDDLGDLFGRRANDSFLVKVSYWLAR